MVLGNMNEYIHVLSGMTTLLPNNHRLQKVTASQFQTFNCWYKFCTHSYENNYDSATKITANPFKHLTLSTHFASKVMETLYTLWQEKLMY